MNSHHCHRRSRTFHRTRCSRTFHRTPSKDKSSRRWRKCSFRSGSCQFWLESRPMLLKKCRSVNPRIPRNQSSSCLKRVCRKLTENIASRSVEETVVKCKSIVSSNFKRNVHVGPSILRWFRKLNQPFIPCIRFVQYQAQIHAGSSIFICEMPK